MTADFLALLSSLLVGGSDFLGGWVTRRTPALITVIRAQSCGFLVILPVALLMGMPQGSGHTWMLLSLVSGVADAVGLLAFYTALAEGTMGVVAGIVALSVVVPVLVGLVRGVVPGWWQALGMLVAIVGASAASGGELRGAGGMRPLLLAVVASISFGVSIAALGLAAAAPAATLAGMRLVELPLLGGVALLMRPAPANSGRHDSLMVMLVGSGSVVANLLYMIAVRQSTLPAAAVLASLFPAVTALLARMVLDERLSLIQRVGLVAVVTGTVLITVG